jgi:hypothetical protein
MGIRTTDAGGEPRGSCSGHVQQREDEVPQRIDGAGERVDAGDDGEPVAHRPDSSVRDLAERHATATPVQAGRRAVIKSLPHVGNRSYSQEDRRSARMFMHLCRHVLLLMTACACASIVYGLRRRLDNETSNCAQLRDRHANSNMVDGSYHSG